MRIQRKIEKIPMFWFPEVYELFYIDTKEGFLRATRLPNNNYDDDETLEDQISLYLIDTGEAFKLKISELPMESFYVMPEDIQSIPGLAIKCQLADHDSVDNETFLKTGTQLFRFFVLENRGNSLVVDILSLETNEMSLNNDWMLKVANEQLESTDNPQIATQGFVTNDKNICEFYDPKTGGCWKGAKCRQLHVMKTSEGIFADKEFVHLFENSPAQIDELTLPEKFNILVTEFLTVNRFICCYEGDSEAMAENIERINNEMSDYSLSPLQRIPANGEIVFVKSEKGLYFRARVETPDDDEQIQVLLLDVGEMVMINLEQLYEMEGSFQDLPILTMEMQIDSIVPTDDDEKSEMAKQLLEIYHSEVAGIFNVEIVDDMNGIKCILLGARNEDIGLELARNGLALEREFFPSALLKMKTGSFILG